MSTQTILRPRPFGASTEFGDLKCAIVCRPGLAQSRVTPSNCHHYLFEDSLWVEEAQKNHDVMVKAMRDEGVEVLELADLLEECFVQVPESIDWLISIRLRLKHHNQTLLFAPLVNWLRTQSPQRLVDIFMGGLLRDEVPDEIKNCPKLKPLMFGLFIIAPLPNLLFQRDPSSIVYDKVTINSFKSSARQNESAVIHVIWKFHPRFAAFAGEIVFGEDPHVSNDALTVEGGDVIVAGKGVVLIGMSQRTSREGAVLYARSLLSRSNVKRVILCDIPDRRTCIHLDTIFSIIDRDLCTANPELTAKIRCTSVTLRQDSSLSQTKSVKKYDPILPRLVSENDLVYEIHEDPMVKVLGDVLKVDMKCVWTGGDAFRREREQWDEGNNVMCIGPRKILVFDRNTCTNEALRQAGVTVIEIPGSEISRGRGGTHCMVFPILRNSVEWDKI